MSRFLATGDQHIGKGQNLYPGRLAEQEANWAATLGLARERDVEAVLHAGDLFDSRRPGPEAMLAAERPLVRHQLAGGPPVIVIPGNHDIPTSDGECGLDVLAEAQLIHLYRRPDVINVVDRQVAALYVPGGTAVAMLPWTPIARLVAAADGVPRDRIYMEAAALVVDIAEELRQRAAGAMVLLGHWSVDGSYLPTGLPVEQLREVVLPLGEIANVGFDTCVFGHIHLAQMFGENALFVGSPMALDHSERGEHGCWILTVGHRPEFVPLPGRRFETVNSVVDDVDLREAIVRYQDVLAAGEQIDTNAIRDELHRLGAFRVTFNLEWERRAREDREPVIDTDLDPVELLRGYLNGTGDTDRLVDLARPYLVGERAEVPA